MLQIAICDDEKRIREQLENLVHTSTKAIIRQFITGEELLESDIDFDIILLDICMNEADSKPKMNGMETAKKIRMKSDAIIIFITALKEYVFEAYDVDAFQYLLKPVDEKKFQSVLAKAVLQVEKKRKMEPLVIKVNGNYKSIPIEDILYAENDARKIILHTKHETFAFYEKMEILENKLGNNFFRSHRGFLVHLQEVESYDNRNIVLKNGDNIFLAKLKYNDFVTAYMNYLRK